MNIQKSLNNMTDKEKNENNIEALHLQEIAQLKVDVQKYNDSAYKAKREIARLQADLDKFNMVAYKAKKEINRFFHLEFNIKNGDRIILRSII